MTQIGCFLLLLGLTAACVALARMMALHKGRSPRIWMWLAAFLGPLPLPILAMFPARPRPQPA